MKKAFILFAKNPKARKVKTLLRGTTVNKAELYCYWQLSSETTEKGALEAVEKYAFYSAHIQPQHVWKNQFFFKQIQRRNDRGEKMMHAFAALLYKKSGIAVAIGADCLEFCNRRILDAFQSLAQQNLVSNRTKKRHYFLGINQFYSILFQNIHRITDRILTIITFKYESLQLDYPLLLVPCYIDWKEDFNYFKNQSYV